LVQRRHVGRHSGRRASADPARACSEPELIPGSQLRRAPE
jgi:hypothetical protein